MLIQLGMALLRQFISIGVLEISIIGVKPIAYRQIDQAPRFI